MDPATPDSDRKQSPVLSSPWPCSSVARNIIILNKKIRTLENSIVTLRDHINMIEETVATCPICSGCTCQHSPSSLESASSWSSNRSCMLDGYDNPDVLLEPFQYCNPNYVPPRTSPIGPPKKLKKNNWFSRRRNTSRATSNKASKKKKANPPVSSKPRNSWKSFLDSLKEETDESTTSKYKSKWSTATKPKPTKSNKKAVSKPKTAKKNEIKLRKVSMGCSPPMGHTTNILASKSTSEEEF